MSTRRRRSPRGPLFRYRAFFAGTFWQSKHHYGTAYHALFGSLRHSVTSILEIGIGEDTAPSVQAWATYFPRAHVYPVDIKTKAEVSGRARPGGATEKLVKHQAQFGCEYNFSMWENPRIHLTLETDASSPEQLKRVALPPELDIILDDGSHKYLDQQTTLQFIPSLDADVRNESASATKVVQQTLLFLGIIFCLSRPLRQLAFLCGAPTGRLPGGLVRSVEGSHGSPDPSG